MGRDRWATVQQTGQVMTVTAHGQQMRLYYTPIGKVSAAWRTGDVYERPLLDHIREQKFTGVAVDAGANVGNHSIWLAVVCGLTVHAFEPVRHGDLADNVALNGLRDRVVVHPLALADRETRVAYQAKGRLDPTRPGRIPAARLDSFGLGDVTVIKADVEGMEPLLLSGAEDTIRRNRPVIFAEEWGQNEHERIRGVLAPWGYTPGIGFRQGRTVMRRWNP